MGKRILKVDLNYPEQQTEASEPQDENQVEETEPPIASADAEAIQEEVSEKEEPIVEAKPKRKAAVKKIIDPEPTPTPIVEPEPIKNKDLVKCQHCNKEMTMKSLKYSHSKNCLRLKKTIEKESKRIPQPPLTTPPPPPEAPQTVSLPIKTIAKTKHQQSQEVIIEAVNPKAERIKVIKEKYNNLVKNAFNI